MHGSKLSRIRRSALLSTACWEMRGALAIAAVAAVVPTASAMDLVSAPGSSAIEYTDQVTACRVRAGVANVDPAFDTRFVVVGRDEGSGSDGAISVITDSNFNIIGTGVAYSVADGVTQRLPATVSLIDSSFSFPLYVGFADTQNGLVVSGQFVGGTAGLVPVTESAMSAAGGACANIVSSNTNVPPPPVNNAPTVSMPPVQTVYGDFSAGGLPQIATIEAGYADQDDDAVSITWSQISGPATTLASNNYREGRAVAEFTRPATAGTVVYEMSADDGNGGVTTGQTTVNWVENTVPVVSTQSNQAPNGPISVGATFVMYAGAVSDPDGQQISYSWVQTGGPPVTLFGEDTMNAMFVVPNDAGPYTFDVSVSDGVSTVTRTVTVLLQINQPPVADAGPDQALPDIAPNSVVSLDGTGSSDPENANLTYTWRQINGPSVFLSDINAAAPTFVIPNYPNTQILEFGLIVSDGANQSVEDTVVVSVSTNEGPVADAGGDQVFTSYDNGDTLQLDGSNSSDPEGDVLTYQWSIVSGNATLSDDTSVTPTLTYTGSDSDGIDDEVIVQLVVSDGLETSAPSQATLLFQDNQGPSADAGANQSGINSGDLVTLDGSNSSDPDGDSLTYRWTQVSGPSVVLSNAASATPTFTAPDVNQASNLVFQLIVNDGSVDSAPVQVAVAVQPLGSISLVLLTTGGDGAFSYSSSLPALNGSISTANGRGELFASRVAAGAYTVTMEDAKARGYALTDLSCSDADSSVSFEDRQATIRVSPGESVICTFSSVNSRGAAQEAIREMMVQRSTLLLSNGPDMSRRIDRVSGRVAGSSGVNVAGLQLMNGLLSPVTFNATATEQNMAASLSSFQGDAARTGKGSIDVWGEATLAQFDSMGKDGNFSVYYVGADYMATDNMLVGVLAQFDSFKSESGSRVGGGDGDGFMIGPYATVRLADRLYADGRFAWGTSENSISPLGSFVDNFDTERMLFSGSLTGDYKVNETTNLRPTVAFRTLAETQKSYVDSLGVFIPEGDVSVSELSFAPRVEKAFELDNGSTWRAYGSAEGIYSMGGDAREIFQDEVRLRLEAGADWSAGQNLSASVTAFADGIGSNSFEAQGLRLSVKYRLK